MHACGHDLHTTALMAAAKALVEGRAYWTGTLIACFQPGEESGLGALGMVSGGLYDSIHEILTPNFVFGGHVTPEPSRTISLTRGTAYSRSNSWKITFKGRGGHGSRPETTIDPITMTAHTRSRNYNPSSRASCPGQRSACSQSAK
ncbi:hypothetical protein BDV06DRAFT_219305 [Aspergillus oleicola]